MKISSASLSHFALRRRITIRSMDGAACCRFKTMDENHENHTGLPRSRSSSAFLLAAAVALVITALAKLGTVAHGSGTLSLPDPVVGFFSTGTVLLMAAASELVVAAALFSRRFSIQLKAGLLAWLASVFICYRMGYWAMGAATPCGCLGHVGDWLRISTPSIDRVMRGVLAALWIGSVMVLAQSHRQKT